MGFFNNSKSDKAYAESTAEQQIQGSRGGYASPWDIATVDDFNRELGTTVNRLLGTSNETWNNILGTVKPFDHWEFLGNYQKGRNASGLKAYPTPSTSQYAQCVENDGVSVWDEKGWWRCLFPRAKIGGDSGELTKEDVEGDGSNKFGLFFKEYNGLMDWKLQVRKMIQEREQKERIARESENLDAVYGDYARDVDNDYNNGVISTSKSTSFKTLANGDAEEITEFHQTFRDGRSEKKKIRKLIPKDGEPIIEDLSDKDGGKKLLNWIWDDKKK